MIRRRGGFTLLEVTLTLLIAGLLIAAIGAALNIHLRVVDSGRAEVEQAQLARALLRRIADDLRSAVPVVVETSGASTGTSTDDIAAASSGTGSAGSSSGGSSSSGSSSSSSSARVQNITGSTGVTDIGGTTSSGSSSSGSSGGTSSGSSSSGSGMSGSSAGGSSSGSSSGSSGSSSGSSSGTDSGQSTAATGEEDTTQPPGVYGTQYDLQIDVTRLPRSGAAMLPQGAAVDATGATAALGVEPPSDVKTVGYYVTGVTTAAPAPPAGVSGSSPAPVPTGGLVRRQVPREAALYSASTGGLDAAQYEQLLATEVSALEFRYYDGTEWLTEWDSSTRQALPVCVEIALTMRSPDADAPSDPLAVFAADPSSTDRTYRLLVHLPGGKPSTGEASTSTSTESTSSSTETAP